MDAVFTAMVAQSRELSQRVLAGAVDKAFAKQRQRDAAQRAAAVVVIESAQTDARAAVVAEEGAAQGLVRVVAEEIHLRRRVFAAEALGALETDEAAARAAVAFDEAASPARARGAAAVMELEDEESMARAHLAGAAHTTFYNDVLDGFADACLVPCEAAARQHLQEAEAAAAEVVWELQAISVDTWLAAVASKEAVARDAITVDEAGGRCVFPVLAAEPPGRAAVEGECVDAAAALLPEAEGCMRRVLQAAVKLNYRQLAVMKQEAVARDVLADAASSACAAAARGCASGSGTLALDGVAHAETTGRALLAAEADLHVGERDARLRFVVFAYQSLRDMRAGAVCGGVGIEAAAAREATAAAEHVAFGEMQAAYAAGMSEHAQQSAARARCVGEEAETRSAVQKEVIAFYKGVRGAMAESSAAARREEEARLQQGIKVHQELQKVPTLEGHTRRQLAMAEAAARDTLTADHNRAKFFAQVAAVAGARGTPEGTPAARLQKATADILAAGRSVDVFGLHRTEWEATEAHGGLSAPLATIEMSLGVVHAAHAAASEGETDKGLASVAYSAACAWLLSAVYRVVDPPAARVQIVLFNRHLQGFARLLKNAVRREAAAGRPVDHVQRAAQLAEGAAVAFGIVYEDSL
eukprot:TRINITY_DN32724_c0_g1_i1.p1 TRINITY_DN32724_c0_g1~~TRINITY_DN32724_c0_g1_i1.p1  ORF type:complete len:702 (+),score=201.34 TRINITY_DN32724_c0_g1_i1:179-2107(+)